MSKIRQHIDDSNIPPESEREHRPLTDAERRAESRVPFDEQEEAARAENEKFQPQDITHGGERDHAGTVTGPV